ncbi:MAG: oxidoreductase [Burkholderiales bacterium]|nr:oxidoreductase [Burkholderiales bacterium]
MSIRPRSSPVRVAEIVPVTPFVKRFRLAATDASPLPRYSGGAHIVVEMRDGGVVRRNPYSLTSSPLHDGDYEISVQRAEVSRGGSVFMHDRVRVGDTLAVSAPVNLFMLDWRARKHVLVAGGIGITPFLAQMAQLSAEGRPFELHYCIRSPERGAYREALERCFPGHVRFYCASKGERLDVTQLVASQPLGTHLYVCGPTPLIDATLEAARAAGWPGHNLHAEHFAAPPSGTPFDVYLQRAGLRVYVGEHESLLEAIEAAGVEVPYLCRGGACGQCETAVLGCDGRLQHHDHWLTTADRAAGRKIMPCVSRFDGRELVLDL